LWKRGWVLGSAPNVRVAQDETRPVEQRQESEQATEDIKRVAQPQVCYDLRIVRRRWLESSIRNFDEARAQELAKLDRIEAEFWAGWERSRRIKQVTSTKRREGNDVSTETGFRKEEQAGNPHFMDGVLKCIFKRCAILGFGAPKKTSGTNPTGTMDYGPFVTENERRNRLLAVLSSGCD